MGVGTEDRRVTTCAATAMGGGMRVVLAPAMHESMYRHPAVRKNLQILADEFHISVVPPKMEEERAKIAEIETICLYVERALYQQDLAGKSVLITSGSCRETVDSVRILTTRSSGTMGYELALEAFRRGADVTVVMNTAVHRPVPCVRNISIESAEDMRTAVLNELKKHNIDYYVSAAAISDFVPDAAETKIRSGTPVTLTLDPAPKLISQVTGPNVIGFKIGEDAPEAAQALLAGQKNIIAVAANYPDTMGSSDGTYRIYRKEADAVDITGTKKDIAHALWNAVL
ncbi:MAG TPA: bifunctional phosphopantothenoylcysteine decarboxylase/phosphopantothenate--cysteine ligase CoaBC, partial [Methanocorpusculum sp.]|nr:bifunctional phosphopantothenoylcysteine decarboxylase/phosphopantothenate--cysteine ligase CoaBC [Methanocorpusculum sp.]